jgi:hypothetical protein
MMICVGGGGGKTIEGTNGQLFINDLERKERTHGIGDTRERERERERRWGNDDEREEKEYHVFQHDKGESERSLSIILFLTHFFLFITLLHTFFACATHIITFTDPTRRGNYRGSSTKRYGPC